MLKAKNDELKGAIVSAIDFLDRKQHEDGLWKDFQLITGQSTSWVTGYVGYSILPFLSDQHPLYKEDAIREKVWKMVEKARDGLLENRSRSGWSWGYNADIFPDSDSTAITLKFLSQVLREDHLALFQGCKFLQDAQQKDGGCSTYNPQIVQGEAYQGWTAPHLSVTMASLEAWALLNELATNADLEQSIQHVINYFRKNYSSDELYTDYWWKGPFYPTYTVISALEKIDYLHLLDKEKIISDLYQIQHESGGWGCMDDTPDCFATSLSLNSILLLHPERLVMHDSKFERALDWLLSQQQNDGSFKPSSYMRIPIPNVAIHDIDETLLDERITVDIQGLFTTATVLQFFNQVISIREDKLHVSHS